MLNSVADNAEKILPAGLDVSIKGTVLIITYTGTWQLDVNRLDSDGLSLENKIDMAVNTALSAMQRVQTCILQENNLGSYDSSLLVVNIKLVKSARLNNLSMDDSGLSQGIKALTKLALAVPPNMEATRSQAKIGFLAGLGGMFLAVPETIGKILNFIGEVTISFLRLIIGKTACTASNTWVAMQESGAETLPIVSLISLLVGLILAFVGVMQLSMFGAEIYVSSLVAVGMTRIMGAIMTGIIIAGRTGAAYAAVIGTMQVNEEIDALSTLGISPVDFLVLPRLIALTVMTPLLVLYADFMGIIGGYIVGVSILGLNPLEYYTFTQKGFSLNNLWVGLIHGAAFGIIIAITGCYQGLRCGRSAEAVGIATTQAVVYSIVGIVIATSILTLLCNALGI